MRSGFKIGKIFGINIRIDWSWLFIFVLVTWNLSFVFGQSHPDWNLALNWSASIAAAILFFMSILAHELSHSLVARAQGVPVRNITLFLFGGVSNIQRHPASPGAEFLITIVGPLTSILLGVVFMVLAGINAGVRAIAPNTNLTNIIAQLSPLNTLLLWLGPINILIGIFNLIPGFPLDGGRILRSILWGITHNLRRATQWASWVGQAVAWLFIAGGIAMVFGVNIPFFGTGLVSGLWLALIGWFLSNAAGQSYKQIVIEDILEDVPVEQIIRSGPLPTVQPTSSVNNLVYDRVMGTDDYAFPVVDNNDHFLGLVTVDNIRAISHSEWDSTPVRNIMTPIKELTVVKASDDAATALAKLKESNSRQLPVVSNGNITGLLRRGDIVRWLQLEGV